jgi:hypothetical protein
MIGKLPEQIQDSTTARYAHIDNDPLRHASERIGNQIAAAMGDLPVRANIAPLKR